MITSKETTTEIPLYRDSYEVDREGSTKEINNNDDATIPTNVCFGLIPKSAENIEPANGANSAIYTKFSIITPSCLQDHQDQDCRIFCTIQLKDQVQLLLH